MSARPGFEARTRCLMAGAFVLAALLGAAPAPAHASVRAPAPRSHGRRLAVHADSLAHVGAGATEPDPWRKARSLADTGRYDDALAVLRAALKQQGDDFGLRWLEAGVVGEADRHRESVALYEKLSADHPDRADELLGDLAAERLGAGDAAGAVRDYRRWLRANPNDHLARRHLAMSLAQSGSLQPALAEYDSLLAGEPDDTDVALERARVLAWTGRHNDAIAAYRAVLVRAPENATARLGVAMNENWAGRHRLATRQLEAIVRDSLADSEARKALAFARYWDGDPAGARITLDDYLRRQPGDAEAQDLSRRLTRERSASLRFEGGRADDSDGLRVVNSGMELRWPVQAATTALLRWRRDNVRDAGGTRDPLLLTAGLLTTLGAAWSVHGELTRTDWGNGPGTTVGGELGVVSRPADRVRLEAGVSREPVLTRLSLALGISRLDWIGAADLNPTESVALHVGGRAGYYSDQNHSERFGASIHWKALERSRAELGLSLTAEQLRTRFDPGHGYYSPDLDREWGPGADTQWHPLPNWTLGATGQVGWQRQGELDTHSFYSLTGRSETVIPGLCTLELEGGRSDSSLQDVAGYKRRWWQLAITRGL